MKKTIKLIKYANKNVLYSKRRSFYVGITIVVSMFILVVSNSLVSGISNNIYREQIYIDSGHVTVKIANPKKDDLDKINKYLENNKNFEKMYCMKQKTNQVLLNQRDVKECIITGCDIKKELSSLKKILQLKQGRFPENACDEVIVSSAYAEKYDIKLGNEVVYKGLADETQSDLGKMKVVGIYKSGTPWRDAYIYTSIDTYKECFNDSSLIMKVYLKNASKYKEVRKDIKEFGKDNQISLTLSDYKEESSMYNGFIDTADAMFNSMDIIVIAVLFIGIQTIIVLSLNEHKKSYLILRVLGYKNGNIRLVIFCEYVFITLVSIITGSILSLIAIEILKKVGIPLKAEVLKYLFGNSVLYPVIDPSNFTFTIEVIVVFVLCSLIPHLVRRYKVQN